MDVVERERRDRQRFVIGRFGTYVLGAGVIILAFASGPLIDAFIISSGVVAMLVVCTMLTRGADAAPSSPQRAGEVMRERARARLRIGIVVRVATIAFGLVTIALSIAHRDAVGLAVLVAIACSAFVWVGSRAIDRRILRALQGE